MAKVNYIFLHRFIARNETIECNQRSPALLRDLEYTIQRNLIEQVTRKEKKNEKKRERQTKGKKEKGKLDGSNDRDAKLNRRTNRKE